jgi:hypothetical protein
MFVHRALDPLNPGFLLRRLRSLAGLWWWFLSRCRGGVVTAVDERSGATPVAAPEPVEWVEWVPARRRPVSEIHFKIYCVSVERTVVKGLEGVSGP